MQALYFALSNCSDIPRNVMKERMGLIEKLVALERERYGNFYFRPPDGESPADCWDRCSDLIDSLQSLSPKEAEELLGKNGIETKEGPEL